MNESIGYTVTLNIIIVFIVIIFSFIVLGLSYYKAYKVSNVVNDALEKYNGYNCYSFNEINKKFSSLGYNMKDISCSEKTNCESDPNCTILRDGDAGVCIYRYSDGDNYYHYKTVTNMMWNIPIINSIVNIPVANNTEKIYIFNSTIMDSKDIDFSICNAASGSITGGSGLSPGELTPVEGGATGSIPAGDSEEAVLTDGSGTVLETSPASAPMFSINKSVQIKLSKGDWSSTTRKNSFNLTVIYPADIGTNYSVLNADLTSSCGDSAIELKKQTVGSKIEIVFNIKQSVCKKTLCISDATTTCKYNLKTILSGNGLSANITKSFDIVVGYVSDPLKVGNLSPTGFDVLGDHKEEKSIVLRS